MRRTATITETKTKGFTIRMPHALAHQANLEDAVETVRVCGLEWIRFRTLNGVSKRYLADTLGIALFMASQLGKEAA